MAKILISHPINEVSIQKLSFEKINSLSTHSIDLDSIGEDVFYTNDADGEIFYIPGISLKQLPEELHDPSLKTLCHALETIQPDVLIVGNNAVPGMAIEAWRKAVGKTKKLLIIRRGVDTRAIDKLSANQHSVIVDNLPGINSPYVAQHMIEYLKLDEAKSGSKIAIIGVGNIGRNVAIKAIECGLSVHLLSPSLQDPDKRLPTLSERGISYDKVICADSIAEVLRDAIYISVAIPWEDGCGGTNIDKIGIKEIKSLATNPQIASASVPRVFTEEALNLMNEMVKQGEMYVRIDTSKRRAVEAKRKYPYIDACHDVAFAAPECQQALDKAMLAKARAFLQKKYILERV
jgi:hypothetical protein